MMVWRQLSALDVNLAEAHIVKARILARRGRHNEAALEIDVAVRLDPETYEGNRAIAYLRYSQRQLDEAFPGCSAGRANHALPPRKDSDPGSAQRTGHRLRRQSSCDSGRGRTRQVKDWISRALLIDPDNMNARYNFACALTTRLRDPHAALEMLSPIFERLAAGFAADL